MKKITLITISLLVFMLTMAQEVFPPAPADPCAVPIVESILGLLGLFVFLLVFVIVFPLVFIIVVLKILRKNKRNN